MKTHFTIFLLFVTSLFSQAASHKQQISSPDGKLKVIIEIGDLIRWSVLDNDQTLIAPSPLSLTLGNQESWGIQPKLQKVSKQSADNIITSPFYKKSQVIDQYNQLTLQFKGNWALVFRAYNDGVAYRFRNLSDKSLTVVSEEAVFNFDNDYEAYVPYVHARDKKNKSFEAQFFNSFESTYTHDKISALDKERLMFLPLVVDVKKGKKVLLTEADLESYPGMYLNTAQGNHSFTGVFAPYPKTTVQGGHNMLQRLVTAREPYIARIPGKQDLPWRVVIISTADKQLTNSDMVYKLASPSRIGDITWIKPGRVAWEWWNNLNIYGVDFKAGINNNTYKYYIDFASQQGIEYVILDEGWAVNKKADMMQIIPEINIQELVDYATDRNVGIILWAGYEALKKDLENICRHYADMGVKGFKVDFFDRDDQEIVDFTYQAAETAARYNLLLDLHGIYKPTGLQRTYPNVLNFEGVYGLENVKWAPDSVDQVTYDVMIPFIRMVAGPMDYTQGAMRNAAKGTFAPIYSEPMSQGTRCRQLATYIVFESPLNMLCDNPSNYKREPESLAFIAQIPVTWDETKVLEGTIGENVIIARRKGNDWYIGGLTNWTPRTAELDLSFLGNNVYQAILFQDGVNADRAGQDYKRTAFSLGAEKQLAIEMAPGGGFALILKQQ
ncbi:glycoside hydrolase family 97 protein [Odoribacter laneus]|uniref:glycoside hydrolase family 97 protein n=1 Tax=Odoribacter laneus TaxID=626933 RepID=UPI000334E7B0|nr:glycoside hydrolase family 97 protein [Odoribacter laneus]CCZ82555.1 putative uncharacterized protein [Odoribacter laneus CAG:561]